MNENDSWIPINRKIFSHEFWKENRTYSKAEAWIDLIQSARFEATQGKMLIGMKAVTWNRGELIASVRFLSGRWNWGLGKVARFLDLLEEEEMIERRISFGQTIVKLKNYEAHNYKKSAVEHQTEHLEPLPEQVLKDDRNTKRNKTGTPPEQERYKTNNVNKENKGESTPAPDLSKSNLYREPVIPTTQEVLECFIQNGGTKEMADRFYETYDATGWYYKGSPLTNFRTKVYSFIDNWKKNESKNGKHEPNGELAAKGQKISEDKARSIIG